MKTETTHTPGKWIVEPASFYSVAYDGYPPIVTCEAVDICEPNPALKDCDAIAALIASAPAMLDELATLRADKAALLEALQEVLETCQAGVIHRSETGKPQWSAFKHIEGIAAPLITKHTKP